MVQSTAATVDEFIEGIAEDRLSAILTIRALCVEQLPDWQERMQWEMPGYGPPGSEAIISFNNQKNYISVYPSRAALDEYREKFKGATFGGGCVRFAKASNIDFAAIADMLGRAYALKGK